MATEEVELLNDDNCILLEFPNENNGVTVGYPQWLVIRKLPSEITKVEDDSKVEDESEVEDDSNVEINWKCAYKAAMYSNAELEEAIHSETIFLIRWPMDVEVMPAKKMMKRLDSNKIKWNVVPAKILACGEWTAMCSERKNMVKDGMSPPIIREGKRRHRQKKPFHCDNEKPNNVVEPSLIKKAKKEAVACQGKVRRLAEMKMLKEQKKLLKEKKLETATDGVDNDQSNYSSSYSTDDEDLSDDDVFFGLPKKNMTKQELLDKISVLHEERKKARNTISFLQNENRKLKKDNSHLETIETTVKGIPTIITNTISMYFNSSSRTATPIIERKVHQTVKKQDMNNASKVYPDDEFFNKSSASNVGEYTSESNMEDKIKVHLDEEFCNKSTAGNVTKVHPDEEFRNKSSAGNVADECADETSIIEQETTANIYEETDYTLLYVRIKNHRALVSCCLIETNIPQCKKIRESVREWAAFNIMDFSRVNKNAGLSKMVCDMMKIMFTYDTLCQSTLTGTKGTKTILDKEKVKFIRSEVRKVFNHLEDIIFDDAFKKAITNKLNNSRPQKKR